MLFQIHDAPGFNGSKSGQTKWKGESHIDDGPYAISQGEWSSVGEHCDFVKAFAEYNDKGFVKVASVIGPIVARRVEALLARALQLASVNAELTTQLEEFAAERDESARALADVEALVVSLKEELSTLRPLNELVGSLIVDAAKASAGARPATTKTRRAA